MPLGMPDTHVSDIPSVSYVLGIQRILSRDCARTNYNRGCQDRTYDIVIVIYTDEPLLTLLLYDGIKSTKWAMAISCEPWRVLLQSTTRITTNLHKPCCCYHVAWKISSCNHEWTARDFTHWASSNGFHFADNYLKCIFLNNSCYVVIHISLRFIQLLDPTSLYQQWFRL